MQFPSLEKLFEIADEIDAILAQPQTDAETADEPDWFGEHFGLFLQEPIELDRMNHTTPANTLTFARTGGDGVHFGVLVASQVALENSPIVMTVPMCFDRPNVIVGANLIDFLNLGLVVGFWYLEQLAYNQRQAASEIEQQNSDFRGKNHLASDHPAIQKLQQAFNLAPWPEVATRLEELNNRFLAQLRFTPE